MSHFSHHSVWWWRTVMRIMRQGARRSLKYLISCVTHTQRWLHPAIQKILKFSWIFKRDLSKARAIAAFPITKSPIHTVVLVYWKEWRQSNHIIGYGDTNSNLSDYRILDELEGPRGRASREFRLKFPNEIFKFASLGKFLEYDRIVREIWWLWDTFWQIYRLEG